MHLNYILLTYTISLKGLKVNFPKSNRKIYIPPYTIPREILFGKTEVEPMIKKDDELSILKEKLIELEEKNSLPKEELLSYKFSDNTGKTKD